MPLRAAALVEDDAHRVLQLVRGAKRVGDAKKSQPRIKRVDHEETLRRHRHGHATPTQPAQSLAQAKTRALMAVYGLRHAVPPSDKPTSKGEQVRSETSEHVSEEKRRELLETRRRIYKNHFSGLQATYGPSGRPKLETLIDAAMDVKRASGKHTSLAVGAAVLTSANRIYTSGRLESAQDAKFDVCAERAALLKVLEHTNSSHRDIEVVEALVICSDQRGLLPVPCGACREFLAEFGDFPVFLLNAENESRETRSFELFPLARDATYTALATKGAADASRALLAEKQTRRRDQAAASQTALDTRDWTCEQVASWLRDVVELPQYAEVFTDKRVDGATLWHLADSDLQLLLGIVHPFHRRRLLVHLDRLRDRSLLDHGVDFAQLTDYIAVLDRDRLDVVAQLKQTFDRLDANGDGLLDAMELTRALRTLGVDESAAVAAQQLLQSMSLTGSGGVTFPAFVQTFSQLAQLPAGEARDAHATKSVPVVDLDALRTTFDKADTNKSGALDEQELVNLLRSLGRDECEHRAREWFAAVDGDGDARISFAEFFQRYAQLTRLDLSVVRAAFDEHRREDTKRCTVKALARALLKLFPHVDAGDIRAWCARGPWASSSNDSKLLTYADFALACVMYGNALRQRVAHLQKLQQTLQNDPLCHRSRIVHLQQSGHVRLCTHPGGDGPAEDETHLSLGERRRRQIEEADITKRKSPRQRHRRAENEDEDGKRGDDEDDNEEDHIISVFNRFVKMHKQESTASQHRNDSDDEGKQQHSDEEDQAKLAKINAVEAAQALQELGIVWSRDQLLRYLDREGFGLRRAIGRREFARVFTRLKAFKMTPNGGNGRQQRLELWEAISRAKKSTQPDESKKTPTKKSPTTWREYDEYLRTKHTKAKKRASATARETLHVHRRGRDDDLDRSRRDTSRRRSRSSSSSSSSSSDRHNRGRSRERRGVVSSRGRSHRGRSRHSSTSSNRSNTSTANSTNSSDESSRCRRRHRSSSARRRRPHTSREPFFRGFEVGDRVTCRKRGDGTLVRLYRDYFVADVRFDSGENAKNVELSHLKRATTASSHANRDHAKRRTFVVGASVRVAHKGTRAASRRGTILRCRTDGTYDVVANECGEQELLARVPLAQLSLAGKPVVYSSGACVTVKRRNEYLRGAIAMCRTNGTYDVRVRTRNGNDTLREVAWELLAPDEADGSKEDEDWDDDDAEKKCRSEPTSRERTRDDDDEDDGKRDDDDFEPEFREGDRVEARFQGQATYYGGRITRVHRDGSCDISYDDGDAESRVRTSFIRAAARSSSAKTTTTNQPSYEDDFESD